jgi:hypothetical protein
MKLMIYNYIYIYIYIYACVRACVRVCVCVFFYMCARELCTKQTIHKIVRRQLLFKCLNVSTVLSTELTDETTTTSRNVTLAYHSFTHSSRSTTSTHTNKIAHLIYECFSRDSRTTVVLSHRRQCRLGRDLTVHFNH